MADLQKFQRACRVLLARLLMVYRAGRPDLRRRMADELEWLEQELLGGICRQPTGLRGAGL